jgi:hypothetical protein
MRRGIGANIQNLSSIKDDIGDNQVNDDLDCLIDYLMINIE